MEKDNVTTDRDHRFLQWLINENLVMPSNGGTALHEFLDLLAQDHIRKGRGGKVLMVDLIEADHQEMRTIIAEPFRQRLISPSGGQMIKDHGQ